MIVLSFAVINKKGGAMKYKYHTHSNKKLITPKRVLTSVCGMIAIFGLVMTGAETTGVMTFHLINWELALDVKQIVVCTAGVCIFALGLFGVWWVQLQD